MHMPGGFSSPDVAFDALDIDEAGMKYRQVFL
jgi:hypothetical protein